MFNPILVALVRSNPLVDLALETRDTLVCETRAAAFCIGGVGFGAGLVFASAVIAGSVWFGALKGTDFVAALTGVGFGAGLLISGASGVRLKLAQTRLNAIKDMVTVRSAREAASKIATAGVEMAITGASSAVELARASAPAIAKIFGSRK
jgi:hypothetical protein